MTIALNCNKLIRFPSEEPMQNTHTKSGISRLCFRENSKVATRFSWPIKYEDLADLFLGRNDEWTLLSEV